MKLEDIKNSDKFIIIWSSGSYVCWSGAALKATIDFGDVEDMERLTDPDTKILKIESQIVVNHSVKVTIKKKAY